MKYLANIFTSGMMGQDSVFSIKHIDETTFNVLKDNAKSYMNNEELADLYNVEYNPKQFQLGLGDTLLVAQKYKEVLDFYCVKVLEVL